MNNNQGVDHLITVGAICLGFVLLILAIVVGLHWGVIGVALAVLFVIFCLPILLFVAAMGGSKIVNDGRKRRSR